MNQPKKSKSTRPAAKQRSDDNFYQILDDFQHMEPPVYQQRPGKPNKNNNHKKLSESQPRQQSNLIKFVPGPVLNPIVPQPHQRLQQSLLNSLSSPPHSLFSNPPPISNQRPTFTVPVEVHRPPSVNSPQPTSLTKNNQKRPSFMDPLYPPITKLTQISAMENGRYALSRLHDGHLLKTVRYFLAYLHSNPGACYEGFTAPHCRTIIGSKGLPTDYEALRQIYVKYNCLFGDSNETDIMNELNALRNHISSNRINHLQRMRESNNAFYNNRRNF
jgi:hypothetical protein